MIMTPPTAAESVATPDLAEEAVERCGRRLLFLAALRAVDQGCDHHLAVGRRQLSSHEPIILIFLKCKTGGLRAQAQVPNLT